MGSHNDDDDDDDDDEDAPSSFFEEDDKGWDPINIGMLAISDLPRPSMVQHSTNVNGADDIAAADASLLAMRRHSALCFE
jgi:hypothetical protein